MPFNYVKSLLGSPAPIHYMVDSDYRTAAQGWSQADGTGPLDMWQHRNPGRVWRTDDHTSDSVALQAANDALVDYRGDTLYFTPGDYSLTAIVTADVPYARWLGTEYKSPKFGAPKPVRNTTITSTLANALTIGAAEGMEFAYFRFVPKTAVNNVAFSTANDGLYWHDFLYDSRTVGTSTATAFSDATVDGAYNDSQFDHFTGLSDAPQGPMFDIAGDVLHVNFSSFLFSHAETGGTLTTGLADITTAGNASDNVTYGPGLIQVGAVGTGVMTSLCTAVAMDGATCIHFFDIISLGLTPAAGALSGGTAADETFVNCYMATSGSTLYTA